MGPIGCCGSRAQVALPAGRLEPLASGLRSNKMAATIIIISDRFEWIC